MIHLKFKDSNKKKYSFNVPTLEELTVKQFIDNAKIIEDNGGKFDVAKYLSYFTGFSEKAINSSNIDLLNVVGITSGNFRDFNKYTYTGSLVIAGNYYTSEGITDFGQRTLITQASEKFKGFEMYVFCVAVALKARQLNFDFESVLKFKKWLMSKPYYEILGAGSFFFLQFLNGRTKEMNFLTRLTFQIKMKRTRLKQILKQCKIMVWFMRLRPYRMF